MSNIVFYRKYRGKKFSEIIGQEKVIKTLMNSITMDNIANAYIFSGSKGVGKTSIAKIFAKALNCLETKDGDVCNKCENCQYINENPINTDILELDAASNNGVDDIREIINNAKYMPSVLKRKVYIIDEAHMLTSQAWNSLLKIIEDSPKHIVFIFATTELHKFPDTIKSRCQVFEFERLSDEKIAQVLKNVIENENIVIDNDAFNLIIKISYGAARDALSILQQVYTYTNNKITSDSINDLFGLLSLEKKISFINNIANKDIEKTLANIEDFSNLGCNFLSLINDITMILIDKLVFTRTNNLELCKFMNNENCKNLSISEPNLLIKIINIFQDALPLFKTIDNPKNILEMISFKIFNIIDKPIPMPNQSNSSIQMDTVNNTNQNKTSSDPFTTKLFFHNSPKDTEVKPIVKDKIVSSTNIHEKKISNTEIIECIYCNRIPELKIKNNNILNSLKENANIPPILSSLILSTAIVLNSNNGIIFQFEDQIETDIFNKTIKNPNFMEEFIKIFGRKYVVLGFSKQELLDFKKRASLISDKPDVQLENNASDPINEFN